VSCELFAKSRTCSRLLGTRYTFDGSLLGVDKLLSNGHRRAQVGHLGLNADRLQNKATSIQKREEKIEKNKEKDNNKIN
jgi:hypothetical protein